MKVTIVDVAKKAGCSIATVSRVMNGNYPVSESMRVKVDEAIEELGFVPNIQASEIKKRSSKTIGVIVPSVDNLFFPEVIKGIEESLSHSGYSLLLCFSSNKKEQESLCFSNLVKRNVAGIIVADPDTNNLENGTIKQLAGNTPVVLINGNPDAREFSFVQTDEYEAALHALEHLWNKNHRQICFVRGTNSYSYDSKEKAYLDFMKEKGIFGENWIYDVGEGNSTEVIEQTKQMFQGVLREEGFTAALCCNDLMAIGVLNACKEAKVKVPSKFALIGCDNTMLCEITEPKLTSIDQHTKSIGKESAKLLIENINSKQARNKRVILSTDLVLRETA